MLQPTAFLILSNNFRFINTNLVKLETRDFVNKNSFLYTVYENKIKQQIANEHLEFKYIYALRHYLNNVIYRITIDCITKKQPIAYVLSTDTVIPWSIIIGILKENRYNIKGILDKDIKNTSHGIKFIDMVVDNEIELSID